MHRIPTFLALAVSLLLAGCFSSQKPMFPQESAVRLLGDGGRFKTFERVGGKDKPGDPMTIRARPNGSYDFVNQRGKATPATFHAIADGMHVAQLKLDGDQGYGYILVRATGKEVAIIPADCDKQDQAKLREAGVEISGQHECRIDKVADPAAFFAQLKRGESVSKMVAP